MGVTRQAVLDTTSGFVGMLEEPDGSNNIWFSRDWGIPGQSWCFALTQSGFYYAPVSPQGQLPHSSMYCPYGIAWARENNQAIEVGGVGPQPGDIVFFSWDLVTWPRWRSGTGDHVGIVEGWDGGDTIWTIEGNVGSPQGVYRKVRSISETVVCFWRPTVFDDSPLGIASLPENDMTPDQANQLDYVYRVLSDENRTVNGMAAALRAQQILERLNVDLYVKSTGGDRNAFDAAIRAKDILERLNQDVYVGTTSGEGDRNAFAELGEVLTELKGLSTGGGGAGSTVDVEGSLKKATSAQLAKLPPATLAAALNEALSAKPKPPVMPPAPPAAPVAPAPADPSAQADPAA